MPMPLRQSLRVGSYLMRQKLAGNKKFPLLVELEPLFACNLKCAGCGKIQQPHTVLKQRMPVEQALAAIEECGAPMVSLAEIVVVANRSVEAPFSASLRRQFLEFVSLTEPILGAEMAEALGCPRGTVKSRLSRALGRLMARTLN